MRYSHLLFKGVSELDCLTVSESLLTLIYGSVQAVSLVQAFKAALEGNR